MKLSRTFGSNPDLRMYAKFGGGAFLPLKHKLQNCVYISGGFTTTQKSEYLYETKHATLKTEHGCLNHEGPPPLYSQNLVHFGPQRAKIISACMARGIARRCYVSLLIMLLV